MSYQESESISGPTHTLPAAERLAQLDEEVVLETTRTRELELVRLKADRGLSLPATFPPESSQQSLKSGGQHRSSTVVKTVEKDLLAHTLDTSEKSKSLA